MKKALIIIVLVLFSIQASAFDLPSINYPKSAGVNEGHQKDSFLLEYGWRVATEFYQNYINEQLAQNKQSTFYIYANNIYTSKAKLVCTLSVGPNIEKIFIREGKGRRSIEITGIIKSKYDNFLPIIYYGTREQANSFRASGFSQTISDYRSYTIQSSMTGWNRGPWYSPYNLQTYEPYPYSNFYYRWK